MFCPWEPAQYLIISSNVPTLLYYSHFLAGVAALIFGSVLLTKAGKSLTARTFAGIIGFFVVWCALDVLLWASNDPGVVLFYWGLQIVLEMLLYTAAFYFAYLFITGRDLSFALKTLLVIAVLPIIFLLPTSFLLPAIDISYCDATETSFVIFYTYAVQVFLSLCILFVGFKAIRQETVHRKEVVIFLAGIMIFLLAFSSGNIIGSITEDWELAQYGLFGMPIFIALLSHLVVKYRAFNLKVLGAQSLVLTLWILIGSLLFVVKTDTSRIVSALTLLISVGFGIALVRSVKREVALRTDLEIANRRQRETMRFITHEVKGYLTDGAAALDALGTGSFGPVTSDMHAMIGEALGKNRAAVREIQNFLRIADFKTGKVAYSMQRFDFRGSLEEALVTPAENAKAKGLSFTTAIAPGDYTMVGDSDQILNHVVVNLVNNAINYTPTGDVSVRLERNADLIRFSVKDSGVGLTEDDKRVLFTEGGHGKESRVVNPHSTGYGLFIAKQIVDAHRGRIWAESAGRDTGSTFFVELPTNLQVPSAQK